MNEFENHFKTVPTMTGPDTPPRNPNHGTDDDDSGLALKSRPKTKKPSLYKVLLLNDDYTPMEFVIQVLEHYFNRSPDEATKIMLHVHERGVGICGVYTYEIAETKANQVMAAARQSDHPLQCTVEKDGNDE